jgi:hypothetical protein
VAVGEPAIVKNLQQNVKYVGMRFLDLIEEHHQIRPAPHRLGELPTFFLTYIARRSADQARHRMALLVFRHIDAHHILLVVE